MLGDLSRDETSVKKFLKLLLQLFHLALAAVILLVGVAEFSVEPTIFDVFGKREEQRSAIPKDFALDVYGINATITNKGLGHILDAPVLFLFLIYFLSVLWLKCRGMFAWLLTCSQVVSVMLYLGVNAGLAQTALLDWRYFSTRAVIILLDVVILSFAWTVLVVTLLHIRGWFPFKVKKYRDIPYLKRTVMQKMIVILWNFIALYLVLGLCLLIWFSKLYMSWACVRQTGEILVMCQFTNMVQCWPCSAPNSHCNSANITTCVKDYVSYDGPIRCISPLYIVEHFSSAFCVFNYNIGLFTIVTVFSYVGGIYFFMRTVLNALVKCLFSIGFIAVHFCWNIAFKIKDRPVAKDAVSVNDTSKSGEVDEVDTPITTSDPHVSLLGPLPHHYGSTGNDSKTNSNKTKYI